MVVARKTWQPQKRVVRLVLGLGGGGWWVSMSGGGQKDVATPKTSSYACFGVGWWWLVGVDRWLWPERHWVVVVVVVVVGKKKKGSPKTSEAFIFGLVVMAGG